MAVIGAYYKMGGSGGYGVLWRVIPHVGRGCRQAQQGGRRGRVVRLVYFVASTISRYKYGDEVLTITTVILVFFHSSSSSSRPVIQQQY